MGLTQAEKNVRYETWRQRVANCAKCNRTKGKGPNHICLYYPDGKRCRSPAPWSYRVETLEKMTGYCGACAPAHEDNGDIVISADGSDMPLYTQEAEQSKHGIAWLEWNVARLEMIVGKMLFPDEPEKATLSDVEAMLKRRKPMWQGKDAVDKSQFRSRK